MVHKINRVGERFINNEGYEFIIIEYNNNKDVWIEFQDEYKAKVNVRYTQCQLCNIRNPYHPSVYGVGYIGEGEYKTSINYRPTKQYDCWRSMLERCYDEEFKKKHPTYSDCFANKETHSFQDFCKWWDNNYYEIEGEQMCLDKDILVKGNKEYSFDKMIFVPQRINKLFSKNDANRGNLPLGVTYHEQTNKYRARCSVIGGIEHLGLYNTSEQAFKAYKEFKEAYIKEVANEYKGRIPNELYNAMCSWVVEIDD